jgi:hypothetical protein
MGFGRALWLAGGVAIGSLVTMIAVPIAMADGDNEGEASLFVPISSYRSYDSRNDPLGEFVFLRAGKWLSGDDFIIDVSTNESLAEQIPDSATAVAFNVTAVGTEGSGFIQIYGPGTDAFSTSTVNWTQSGLNIANSGSTMLGACGESCAEGCGKRTSSGCFGCDTSPGDEEPGFEWIPGFIGVAVGGPAGTRTHIVIDITGYYTPAPAG